MKTAGGHSLGCQPGMWLAAGTLESVQATGLLTMPSAAQPRHDQLPARCLLIIFIHHCSQLVWTARKPSSIPTLLLTSELGSLGKAANARSQRIGMPTMQVERMQVILRRISASSMIRATTVAEQFSTSLATCSLVTSGAEQHEGMLLSMRQAKQHADCSHRSNLLTAASQVFTD